MSMVTSPDETSLERAARMITASARHDGGEHADAEDDFGIHRCTVSLQLHAGERHEAQRHQADGDEGDAQALQAPARRCT